MPERPHIRVALFVFATILLGALPTFAKESGEYGRLKIHVSPKQAYVFVDGKAIRDGSQTIKLPEGSHEVGVYNYGYLPKTQEVQIRDGETTSIQVALQASGDKVSGPFGDIEFKGHPRAAVLLDGKTPAYFVGHVDEFDWNWIWHQRLLVRPGTYQVTVTREGNTVWSGSVPVKGGQQVTVYLDRNGETKTKNWPQGNRLGPQPRFHAGIASATVPVSPVAAQLTAQSSQLSCGQSTQLNWKAADAVDISITNIGNVAASSTRSVSPTRTITYELVAKGPGGEARKAATVDVNAQPTAALILSEPEVRYHRIGDKVVEQDSAVLRWSTSNANKVTIQPLGAEALDGSETIEAHPKKTTLGPIDENVVYRLTSSNACGGTTTQTATLHIVGSNDPVPPVTLLSVFYPTAYPRMRHRKVGLVESEQKSLQTVAASMKNLFQYENDAKLMVVAHADVRGSKKYNLALTERRADSVKDYLVSQGIVADKIETRAEGKERQLDEKQVQQMQSEDPQKPENWMMHHAKSTWLAYNRRVDIILEPKGQESTEAFPNEASDARILWQRPEPNLRAVELASEMPRGAEHAELHNSGN